MGLSKKHWQWLGFFVAGTFLGGYVLGVVTGLLGKLRGH